jgi:hypothetical protein
LALTSAVLTLTVRLALLLPLTLASDHAPAPAPNPYTGLTAATSFTLRAKVMHDGVQVSFRVDNRNGTAAASCKLPMGGSVGGEWASHRCVLPPAGSFVGVHDLYMTYTVPSNIRINTTTTHGMGRSKRSGGASAVNVAWWQASGGSGVPSQVKPSAATVAVHTITATSNKSNPALQVPISLSPHNQLVVGGGGAPASFLLVDNEDGTWALKLPSVGTYACKTHVFSDRKLCLSMLLEPMP